MRADGRLEIRQQSVNKKSKQQIIVNSFIIVIIIIEIEIALAAAAVE